MRTSKRLEKNTLNDNRESKNVKFSIIKINELNGLLKKQHEELRADIEALLLSKLNSQIVEGFCNRFYDVFVSPTEVANMHGVYKDTVIAYIKDGAIAAEQSQKYGDYHIRLSDALLLDFKEMRKQLRRKQS
ncbi:MAG: hypothetical protein LBF69_05265 [Prevotellaceae bacterium]|jgi:hypothetical protein|nr:hypothetical protein [Prevotellaceae bacterium]